MSIISELVDRLRAEGKSIGTYGMDYMATLLTRSADTIEMLSEKARDESQADWYWRCPKCDHIVPNLYDECVWCLEPKPMKPKVVMPKKCKGCDSASKIIEAYSRGFEDGAEAVKAVEVKALHKDYIEPYVTIEGEPQTDGILFKGNLKEGDYKLIKTTDGWVLEGEDIVYCGWERGNE